MPKRGRLLETTALEVDAKRIGVIGHSEGGQVALMLGADSPDVAFVISLAGVGVDGLQILKLQNDAILRTTPGMTPERVDQFMSLLIRCLTKFMPYL